MTEQSAKDHRGSFSLKHKKRKRPRLTLLSWQEQAYERLKTLYKISKLLSSFESIEELFPKIFMCGAESFPLLTAVLIDHWEAKPKTTIWHSEKASQEQISLAILNAREAYAYLAGSTALQSRDLQSDTATITKLHNVSGSKKFKIEDRTHYIIFPLIVDNLPARGALQLEGTGPLNEKDVEFADALANLVAVAMDRFYKTERESALRKSEANENYAKFSGSQVKVANLEKERELREGFVSLLTHDLRTPLSAANLAAQLIPKQISDPEAIRSLADQVVKSVKRADEMIGNLLDANRIRSGESLPLTLERFNLSTLIKETLEELAAIHGQRFILLGNEPIEGFWDRKGLRRIIENLCVNAIKYGYLDSPVTISLKSSPPNVQISVQNFGELILPEEQKSLFYQFRRGKSQSEKKGWGIGLTLVRGVAEAHGGHVGVISNEKVGTIFTVTLPRDAREPGSPSKQGA